MTEGFVGRLFVWDVNSCTEVKPRLLEKSPLSKQRLLPGCGQDGDRRPFTWREECGNADPDSQVKGSELGTPPAPHLLSPATPKAAAWLTGARTPGP